MKKQSFHSVDTKQFYQFIRDNYSEFRIEKTAGVQKIKTNDCQYIITDRMTGKAVFMAYNKLKSELIKYAKENGIPEVERQKIRYYQFNENIPEFPESCFSVDLNKAYIQCLHNYGCISNELFNFLSGKAISKKDRLKVTGMLASRKTIIERKEGKTTIETYENELSNFFYLCCRAVTEILSDYSKTDRGFLFYWTDAVFTEGSPEKAVEFFNNYGYPSKIERVEKIKRKGNYLIFVKDGRPKIQPVPQKKKRITDVTILRLIG